MKWLDDFPFYWEAFVRLWYPAYCGGCGSFLQLSEEEICHVCRNRMQSLWHSPEEAVIDETFECLDNAWAAFDYASPVKELITGIKFHKKRWFMRAFSEAIRRMAVMIVSENHYDGLLPVPISGTTRIKREFNQAELIAAEFRSAAGVPVMNRLLRKSRNTVAQSRLTQKERRINPSGVFELSDIRRPAGRSFLIMDDIITTGATAEEAARILKKHGATRVDLFALARTPRTS